MKTSSDRTADTPLPYTRTEARLPLTLLDRASARVRPHATRRPLVVVAVAQRFGGVEIANGDREPGPPVALGRRTDG
jgi:hypothetical protein